MSNLVQCPKEDATVIVLFGGSQFRIRYIDNLAKISFGKREWSMNKFDIWQITESFWK